MHESCLIAPIIKGIAEHALREGAKRVTKVKMKVGKLTGMKEASLRAAFDLLAQGTPLEAAELEVVFFPGTIIQVLSFDIA